MMSIIELNEMSKKVYPHTLKKGDLIKTVFGYEEILEVEVKTTEVEFNGKVYPSTTTTIKTNGKIPVQSFKLAEVVIVVRGADLVAEETVEETVEVMAEEVTAEVVAPVVVDANVIDADVVVTLNSIIELAKAEDFNGGFVKVEDRNVFTRYILDGETIEDDVILKVFLNNDLLHEDELVIEYTKKGAFICSYYTIGFNCERIITRDIKEVCKFFRDLL